MFKARPRSQLRSQLRSQFVRQVFQDTAGLTLLETVVSMPIFLAVLAGVVPVYMVYKLQTLNNPVRTGAVVGSQQILEQIRQINAVDTLPSTGTFNQMPTPISSSLNNLDAYGKTYSAQISYCEKATFCNTTSRYIRVAVFQQFGNGSLSSAPVYEVSTVFTKVGGS